MLGEDRADSRVNLTEGLRKFVLVETMIISLVESYFQVGWAIRKGVSRNMHIILCIEVCRPKWPYVCRPIMPFRCDMHTSKKYAQVWPFILV